jgi:hypothetical protein
VVEQQRVGGLGGEVPGEQARRQAGLDGGGDRRGGGRDDAVADVGQAVLARRRAPGRTGRDLAAAEPAQRAERPAARRACSASARSITSRLCAMPASSRPVPGPTSDAAGRPVSHAARQVAGRRVADAHLAAGQDGDAVGGGLRGERPAGVDGGATSPTDRAGSAARSRLGRSPSTVTSAAACGPPRDARVDEQDLGAGLAGQRADRAATRANVASICAVTAGG